MRSPAISAAAPAIRRSSRPSRLRTSGWWRRPMSERDLRQISTATNPDIDAAGFTPDADVSSIGIAAPATPPGKPEGFSVVGKATPKVNSFAAVTGAAIFADDVVLPRMLYGKMLRSTKPHARLVK